MKIFKTVNFAIIVMLGSVTLAFCSCKRGPDIDKTVLEVAIQSNPVILDPRLATDAESDKICQLIFDGLMKRNDKLDVVPNLAQRYEQISDTQYRFFLRHGVVFHSGKPFTAQDVFYTFKSILEGPIISPFKESFSRIKDIAVEDDYTVRFDLKEPYAPFLTLLAKGIVSKEDVLLKGDNFAMEPVGTGPYKLVRFVPNSLVEFEANSAYFDSPPKTRFLRLHVIGDDNIRVLKLMKGDIDIVQNGIPSLLLPKVLQTPGIAMMAGDGVVMSYLGMNLTDKHLKDPRVRKAIAYAIDRDQIITHRFGGMAAKADSILSPLNWAHADGLWQYEYDKAKAEELLDEAGLKVLSAGKRFYLSYKTSTVKERIEIAQLIAHQLGEVGIDVKVEPYEWGVVYNDIKTGNFEIYTLSWVGVTEPDFFFDVCHSSQFPPNGFNRSRYKNPKVDELVEKGRITMKQGARKSIYDEVQKIVLDDLPYIPLWYEKNVVVYKNTLKGMSLRPDASYLTFVNISKE